MGGGRRSPVKLAPLDSARGLLGDPEALAARAEREGYLYLPSLAPLDAVEALRDRVLDEVARSGWLAPGTVRSAAIHVGDAALGRYDDPRWIRFMQRVVPDPSFGRLAVAHALLDVLATVMGGPVETRPGGIVRVVSSGDPSLGAIAHQDAHYIPDEPSLWTAWLPLTDCPLRRGPLAVLPGSHREGLRPHVGSGLAHAGVEVAPEALWRSAHVKPGDVLLFSGLTVHASLPNESGRLRLSVDYRYRRAARGGGTR